MNMNFKRKLPIPMEIKEQYPNHNLDRARNQFKLCLDMEAKWQELAAVVEKYMN